MFFRLLSHPIHGKLASVMPNLRKRHSEADLNTSLFSVLSVRLREGYTIRDIAITKGKVHVLRSDLLLPDSVAMVMFIAVSCLLIIFICFLLML